MISALHLIWIVPLALGIGGFIGVTVMCCLFVAKEADRDINEKTNKRKVKGENNGYRKG